MKISYNWLQTYFDAKLPAGELVAEMLTLRAYEVESIEKIKLSQGREDFVFEIDILPNRAHDSLCHRGVAREVGAIFNMAVAIPKRELLTLEETAPLLVKIEDGTLCRRYLGRAIEGVKVGPSPDWLKDRLSAVGQKSINNIIDVMNYIMLDMGEPMHAFDADKLDTADGEIQIVIRNAKTGEEIITLDGKEVVLDENMLVIADAEGPLAIAGVKGGKKAEVDDGTTAIILEAANFHPTAIRKTSQKTGIRTDSSKRFENEVSSELAPAAIKEAARLIADMSGGNIRIGSIVDEFPAQGRFETHEIAVTGREINELLGTSISHDGIESIIKALGWVYRAEGEGDGTKFRIIAPPERLDIAIKEDVIEEIGRVYGYENISLSLPKVSSFAAKVNKEFYYANTTRNILTGMGFSEVETSSFSHQGKIGIENPIADGKEFLRESLQGGIEKALELNFRNAALLGLDVVKIFEIGSVFGQNGEHTEVTLGVLSLDKKNKEDVKKEVENFFEKLEVKGEYKVIGDVAIINFAKLLESMPPPLPRGGARRAERSAQVKFQKISPYPFIVRDIALFVPKNVQVEEIAEILAKHAGNLLAREPKLFDRFQKPGSEKVSYAFRLIFQSHEKTLTDEEVNAIMQKITAVLQENGWEVR